MAIYMFTAGDWETHSREGAYTRQECSKEIPQLVIKCPENEKKEGGDR